MRYAYKGYFAYLRKPAHTDEEKRVRRGCAAEVEIMHFGYGIVDPQKARTDGGSAVQTEGIHLEDQERWTRR